MYALPWSLVKSLFRQAGNQYMLTLPRAKCPASTFYPRLELLENRELLTCPSPPETVLDYGATGDGLTNDTAAIQAALDNTPSGCTLLVPQPVAYYLVDDSLRISQPVHLLGAVPTARSELRLLRANTPLLKVQSDDVEVAGLRLVGRGFGARIQRDEFAIEARKVADDDILSGLVIRDNEVNSWGFDGIHLRYGSDFRVLGNTVTDVTYAGMDILSSERGTISQNIVRHIVNVEEDHNAYGIALSRETPSDRSYPCSREITVTSNLVEDVPSWEAYDTHCGQDILFRRNTARRAMIGIAVTRSLGLSPAAPRNVDVTDNTLEEGVTTGGDVGNGIVFSGVDGGEKATGSILRNTVCGFGAIPNYLTGGLYIQDTDSLVVQNNDIIEPPHNGIALQSNNYRIIVANNSVIGRWDLLTGNEARAVGVLGHRNTASVMWNAFLRGQKYPDRRILDTGIRVGSGLDSNQIFACRNRSEATTYIVAPPGVIVRCPDDPDGNQPSQPTPGGLDKEPMAGREHLIACTAHDTPPAHMVTILTEWTRTHEIYDRRVANLTSGSTVPLLDASTVHSNGGGNALVGNNRGTTELNLFFGTLALDVYDWNPLTETFIAV